MHKRHFGSSHTVLYAEVVLCSEARTIPLVLRKVSNDYWDPEVVPCSEGHLCRGSTIHMHFSTRANQ